ncbi:MAG: Gfo/Idh/MocA family oxidoreductase [Fibrobacteres bacterium]|nr:Gfo/Idh/MocA family oxidoreductase [Fibrobacterota bacterium]
MNLGIVGAENSHAAAVANLINVQKKIKGFRVTQIWGETPAFAESAALKGEIPIIVNKPEHMIGQIDCVMIDHRDGKYHLPVAEKFIKAGLPVFVDKPLSVSLKEAKTFLKLRKKYKVPVTTLSAMPLQTAFLTLCREVKKIGDCRLISFVGPGDFKSKYSGLFFYFIHQVDMMVDLMGGAPVYVQVTKCGNSCTSQCEYKDGRVVTLTMDPSVSKFHVTAIGSNSIYAQEVATDPDVHLASAKIFTRMFTTGKEPFSDTRMLLPIATLEAMVLSLEKCRRIKVGDI